MLSLSGMILNVFQAPSGTTKEGEKYGGGYKVQLQGSNVLRNGETRIDLITLACKAQDVFKKNVGKNIRVPVGAFVGNGAIQYYITDDVVEVLE